jgi:hypothetical protein
MLSTRQFRGEAFRAGMPYRPKARSLCALLPVVPIAMSISVPRSKDVAAF